MNEHFEPEKIPPLQYNPQDGLVALFACLNTLDVVTDIIVTVRFALSGWWVLVGISIAFMVRLEY